MSELEIILSVICVLLLCGLIYIWNILIKSLCVLKCKVAYYEETLKNNKDLFTNKRYNQIEDVMKCNSIKDVKDLLQD